MCVCVQCRHNLKLSNVGKADSDRRDSITVICLSTGDFMERIPEIIHPEMLSPILSHRTSAAQHTQSADRTFRRQKRHPHKQKWPEITTV